MKHLYFAKVCYTAELNNSICGRSFSVRYIWHKYFNSFEAAAMKVSFKFAISEHDVLDLVICRMQW